MTTRSLRGRRSRIIRPEHPNRATPGPSTIIGASEKSPQHPLSQLAIDFANTVGCPSCHGVDALGTSDRAERWLLARMGTSPALFEDNELVRLRALRDAVRSLLHAASSGKEPPRRSLRLINAALRARAVRARLDWIRGSWTTHLDESLPAPVPRFRDRVAWSTVEALTGPSAGRVRPCQGPGCVHYLVARTVQHRWCSPSGCGNRARAQRHHLKLRSLDPRSKWYLSRK